MSGGTSVTVVAMAPSTTPQAALLIKNCSREHNTSGRRCWGVGTRNSEDNVHTAGIAILAGSMAMNPKRLMRTSKLSAAKLRRPASSTAGATHNPCGTARRWRCQWSRDVMPGRVCVSIQQSASPPSRQQRNYHDRLNRCMLPR